MRGELKRIKAFLRIPYTMEDSDEEVKVWVKKIRDVAQDVLNGFTILSNHDHGSGLYRIFHKMSCCVKNMKARYWVVSEIKEINTRIRNISEGHRRLHQKFYVAEQAGSSSNSAGNLWQDSRGDALLLDFADLVGIDEPKEKLVGWLLQVYKGHTLQFKAGGFKKLKLLGIDKFDELRCIEVEVGALSRLETLCILRCKSLEQVPLGIEQPTKLKVLEFFDMPWELIETLRPDEKGGDYWRVAHIPEMCSTCGRDGEWKVYSLENFNVTPLLNPVIRSQEFQTRWK